MALLSVFKPEEFASRRLEHEPLVSSYIEKQPVDLGVYVTIDGLKIRFLVKGMRASWWGELDISMAHAETLKNEIESMLKEKEEKPRLRIPEINKEE